MNISIVRLLWGMFALFEGYTHCEPHSILCICKMSAFIYIKSAFIHLNKSIHLWGMFALFEGYTYCELPSISSIFKISTHIYM